MSSKQSPERGHARRATNEALATSPGQAPKRGRTTSGETASALGCAAQRTRPTRSGTRFLPEASCPAGGELLSSPPAVLVDNITEVKSAALAAAITSRIWTDRLIGTSRDVHVEVHSAWVLTGNDPALSRELAGRAVRIRLDAGMDHPEERTDFRHPRLRQWAESHRPELVRASLVLINAWVAEGCPEGSATLGGFEPWSGIMGGIFEVVGIEGFLQDREHLYAASDVERSAKRQFVQAWREQFGFRPVGVGDLFPVVVSQAIDLDLGDGTERSRKSRLGKLLARARDTVIDGYQIVPAGDRQRAQLWKLVRVGAELREVS